MPGTATKQSIGIEGVHTPHAQCIATTNRYREKRHGRFLVLFPDPNAPRTHRAVHAPILYYENGYVTCRNELHSSKKQPCHPPTPQKSPQYTSLHESHAKCFPQKCKPHPTPPLVLAKAQLSAANTRHITKSRKIKALSQCVR